MKNASTLLLLGEFRGHRPETSKNSARNSNCNPWKINKLCICVHFCLYVHPKGSIRPILWMWMCQWPPRKKSHWQPKRCQENNSCLFIHEHIMDNQVIIVMQIIVIQVITKLSYLCIALQFKKFFLHLWAVILSKLLQQKVRDRIKIIKKLLHLVLQTAADKLQIILYSS